MTTVEDAWGGRRSPKAYHRSVVRASSDHPRIGLVAGIETTKPAISANNRIAKASNLPGVLIRIGKSSWRRRKCDESPQLGRGAGRRFAVDAKHHLPIA